MLMEQGQPAVMADMPACAMGAACPDCGANAADHGKTDKSKAPGCMAMTACAAVLAIKGPAAPAAGQHQAKAASFWSTAAILAGRDVAPEPEPPTFLG
jgi:hypothetical protein